MIFRMFLNHSFPNFRKLVQFLTTIDIAKQDTVCLISRYFLSNLAIEDEFYFGVPNFYKIDENSFCDVFRLFQKFRIKLGWILGYLIIGCHHHVTKFEPFQNMKNAFK